MGKTEITFDSDNADMAEASAYWYDRDGVFIRQTEIPEDGKSPHVELLLIGRDGVPRFIEALQQFLNQ
jgi:hypothetical protein